MASVFGWGGDWTRASSGLGVGLGVVLWEVFLLLGRVDGVRRVETCELRVVSADWAYARENCEVIERNWERNSRDNPAFFNGSIFLMAGCEFSCTEDHSVTESLFRASFLKTDFKSYLYWRQKGFPVAGVSDGFGSAIVRSKEGHVILGRQGKGHVNEGLAYLPGGFIDLRDALEDGSIDIDASVAREVFEETGLDAKSMTRTPGYYLTFDKAQVSIAVEYRSGLPAVEICRRIRAHLALERDPELSDVCVITNDRDLGTPQLAPYCVPLLGAIFQGGARKT